MNERRWTIGLLFPVCMLACHSSSSGTDPAPSASANPMASAAGSAFAKRPHRSNRGGAGALLFNAAYDLPNLTDDQKAKLDASEDETPDHDTGPRDVAKTFSTDLAAQIRANKIDAAKLQPDEAAMDAALNATLDKQAKALADLHDVLDTSQRTALAINIHAGIAASPDPAADHDAGALADRVANQVDRMAKDLSLDDAQKKQATAAILKDEKVRAATPPPDHRKDLDALLTAFQGDTFDAKQSLTLVTFGGKPPHEGMDEQIKKTALLLTILHPDQREQLAVALEKPPAMQRPGPGGGMRGPNMRGPNMRGVGPGGGGLGGGGNPAHP